MILLDWWVVLSLKQGALWAWDPDLKEDRASWFWCLCGETEVCKFRKNWICCSAKVSLVTSLVVHRVKNLSTMRETWVWSQGQEDPLEKGMAIHCSTLAYRIPWTEEPEELQSVDTTERLAVSLSLSVNVLPLQSESTTGPIPGNCKQIGRLPGNRQDVSQETDRTPSRKQTGRPLGNRQDVPQETDRTPPRKQAGCHQETGCPPGNRQGAPQETYRMHPRKQDIPQETNRTPSRK